MSVVGGALVVGGAAATVWGLMASHNSRGARAVAAAIVAPLALLAALLGGVLVLVPGFLG